MRRETNVRVCGLLCMLLLSAAQSLLAHPMGNFSINHYTRLNAHADRIDGLYVLDMAEIPTVTEMSRLDTNQDGKISAPERAAYLHLLGEQISRELSLRVDGQSVVLEATPQDVTLRPGAGGLNTLRITLKLSARLPASDASSRSSFHTVEYKDANFPVRTGWKEIVVIGDPGLARDSSVPATDLSKELTVYPADPSIAPPQVTEARFTLSEEGNTDKGIGNRADPNTQHPTPNTRTPNTRTPEHPNTRTLQSSTPQDRFTQSIAVGELTPGLAALSLLSAFGFGALHALSPGHGKAMVAAYLIGTKGTARHAVLLGLVVTLTHTLGVFALGLITLSASKYIVPERLYPLISALSGLAVTGMGAGLLWSRLRAWGKTREEGNQERAQETGSDVEDSNIEGSGMSASRNRTNAPATKAAKDAVLEQEFYYQRRDAGALSMRTLVGLGITGGALPCPSALVVMLSAIALHRIVFGLLLIVAFSLGLAVVLTVLGVLVMRARGVMERVSPGAKWMPGLSALSAACVTAIGLLLLFRSLTGRF